MAVAIQDIQRYMGHDVYRRKWERKNYASVKERKYKKIKLERKTLMVQITKVFGRTILNRIKPDIEKATREKQHGLREGASTIDLIFGISQLYEKKW